MTSNTEKFSKLVSKDQSNTLQNLKERKKNRAMLRESKDIAFKVDNFNRENMLSIEKKWGEIIQNSYCTSTHFKNRLALKNKITQFKIEYINTSNSTEFTRQYTCKL